MGGFVAELFSNLLLFALVFGMSATVELSHMKKQIHNWRALLIGISLQFVLLPFIGFMVVKIFNLPSTVGITLLVITSSPGGSYSNWWCSMFNAELALSVTMTAASTFMSCIMLPINLLLYTRYIVESDSVVQSLDWRALFVSLIVVIGGIASGLVASYSAKRWGNANLMHRRANQMGNVAGLCLITLSVAVSSLGNGGDNQQHDAAIWDQNAKFYIACALPPILGLCLAVSLASYCELEKPERVAVSVESCYQNTGIATTVALTMFQNQSELATAIGVPLYYGLVEALVILTFLVISWQMDWTKAPSDENICVVLTSTYEVERDDNHEQEGTAIEVVLSSHNNNSHRHHDKDSDENDDNGDDGVDNLIFAQTDRGDYIVDEGMLQDIEKAQENPTRRGWSGGDTKNGNHLHHHHEEDPTLCSDDEGEPDGVMFTTTASTSIVNEGTTAPLPSSSDEQQGPAGTGKIRRRTMLSSIRARATGYRPQKPLSVDDDEHDHRLHTSRNTRLSIMAEEEHDDENSDNHPPSPAQAPSGRFSRNGNHRHHKTSSSSYATLSGSPTKQEQQLPEQIRQVEQQQQQQAVPHKELEDEPLDDLSL